LAERLAGTADPADALILRDAIVRGFYGAKPDAQSPTPQPPTGSAAAPARPDPAAANHA